MRAHNYHGGFYYPRSEKYILRKAFEHSKLLPKEVLFRQKEGFSDGVSNLKTAWFEIIANYVKTDKNALKIINSPYSHLKYKVKEKGKIKNMPAFNPPKTPEQIYYRKLFGKYYKDFCEGVPYFWMPRFVKNATDASARTLQYHKKTS